MKRTFISVLLLFNFMLLGCSVKYTANPITSLKEHKSLQLIDEKSVYKHITAVSWSSDGKLIGTAGGTTEVLIWDAASLTIRHRLDQGFRGGGDDHVTFSPDGRYLASGLKVINIWNSADGTLFMKLVAPHMKPEEPIAADVKGLRLSPDGKTMVVAYGGEMRIVVAYRIATGEIAWTYEPRGATGRPLLLTTPLVLTPDGKRLILGTSEFGGPDANVRWLSKLLILDAETGKFLSSIDDIHTGSPTALAISPDGKRAATGTATGVTRQTTNLKTHQTITTENRDPVRIWDMQTRKLLKELQVGSTVLSLAFSRDGKYLFGARHLTMMVWNIEAGTLVQEIESNPAPMSLAVSPDGKRLAAACQSKLSIYEIRTGK